MTDKPRYAKYSELFEYDLTPHPHPDDVDITWTIVTRGERMISLAIASPEIETDSQQERFARYLHRWKECINAMRRRSKEFV